MVDLKCNYLKASHVMLQQLFILLIDLEEVVRIMWQPSTSIEVCHELFLQLLERVVAH